MTVFAEEVQKLHTLQEIVFNKNYDKMNKKA